MATQRKGLDPIGANVVPLAGPFPPKSVLPTTNHLNPEVPDTYVFREINVRLTGDRVHFEFLSPLPPMPTNGQSIESIVDQLRNPTLMTRALVQAKRFYWKLVAPLVQAHHLLHPRPETPLDLNITRPRYVILRLVRTRRWQFSSTKEAVEHKYHPTDDYSVFYGGLRHVPRAGGQPTAVPQPDCDMVYFVSNPPPQPTPGQDATFRHSFNFHVELEQEPRVDVTKTPPEIIPRMLPVVLDPDIRNPDGTPS